MLQRTRPVAFCETSNAEKLSRHTASGDEPEYSRIFEPLRLANKRVRIAAQDPRHYVGQVRPLLSPYA